VEERVWVRRLVFREAARSEVGPPHPDPLLHADMEEQGERS